MLRFTPSCRASSAAVCGRAASSSSAFSPRRSCDSTVPVRMDPSFVIGVGSRELVHPLLGEQRGLVVEVGESWPTRRLEGEEQDAPVSVRLVRAGAVEHERSEHDGAPGGHLGDGRGSRA